MEKGNANNKHSNRKNLINKPLVPALHARGNMGICRSRRRLCGACFFFLAFFSPQAVGVFYHSGSFTINAKKTPTTPSPVNNKQKGVVDMEGEMPREAARMRTPADAICHLDNLRERCQICSSGGTPRREREGLRRAEGRKGGRNTAVTGQDQPAHSLCWEERECLTV